MSSICIAGMHRSGTSMVSRVLNLAGLYLGADEKIMPPAPENQEGFWEHLDIVAINEEVLASIGAAWDFIPEFESGWETADALNSLYERAREILQPFEKQEFWGWKDPRNSITLPFWKHLLPDVKVILCVRHPLEVAQSLRSRNGSSIIFGLNLWYQYNLALVEATRPEERIVTHYDAFFFDPGRELKRIFSLLGRQLAEDLLYNALTGVSAKIRHIHLPPRVAPHSRNTEDVFQLYYQLCEEAGEVFMAAQEAKQTCLDDRQNVKESTHSLFEKSKQLIEQDQSAEAIQVLKQVVEGAPHHSQAHNELGFLFYQEGQKSLAFHHLNQAAQLNPNNLTAKINLADLSLELQLYDFAKKHYLEILKTGLQKKHALLQLGKLNFQTRQMREARECYQKVLDIDPGNQLAAESLRYPEMLSEIQESAPESQKIQSANTAGKEHRSESSSINVSIIIPVFNKVHFTKQCLKYLYRNTSESLRFEVIVVDNGSTDETPEFLKKASQRYPRLRVVTNPKNLGFSAACNIGAEHVSGKYIHFLNNDTKAQPGWLEPLLAVLNQDKSVAAAGSKLLFPNGTVQHAGVALVEDHKIPDPVAPRHIYYGMSPDHPDLHQMRTFKVLTAASLLLRREVFNSVGGYDEDFWNGYEDVDLCFKIYQKGWKLVYHPESVLIHYEKQSGKERFIKAFQNIERLHRLWKGKINPDYIIHQDGSMTEAPENAIKPYTLPAAGRAGATVPEKRFEKQDHSKATAPLVSIIILTYNQLSKTKECLQSIAQYTTSIKHEVIVVDNGSRDGTVRYLKQWVTKQPYYHLIRNSKNKGFPAGNNQGIRKARGDYILLLNNDVVVTEDWLSGLVQAIERDNSLGLVGPMTNYISGMQLERDVTYQNQKELQEFAKAYRQRHQGELQTVHRLIGFCLMIKKQVIDDIGLLDERFGKGNYEDDDFCLRANLADYKLAIAREVFIHHYGNSSFSGGNVDYLNSLAKNRDIFIEKWKDIQHPHPLWIEILLEKAKWEEVNGNVDEQERMLEWAFKLEVGNRQVLERYENCLTEQQKTDQVIRIMEKYVEKNPQDGEVINALGVHYWQTGNLVKAAELFEQAVNNDSNRPDFLKNLADAHLSLEKFEQAIPILVHLIEKFPDDVEAYLKMANLYLESGDAQSAKAMLEKAQTKQPDDTYLQRLQHLLSAPSTFFAYQMLSQDNGNSELDVLEKTVSEEAAHLSVDGCIMLGQLFLENGRGSTGQTLLKRAQQLDPQNKEIMKLSANSDSVSINV